MDVIDWRAAQRIGELVGGLGGASNDWNGLRADTVEPRALEFAALVSEYSRLPVHEELPRLELVDRPGWIAANLTTMRPLLAPLTEKVADQKGPLGGPMRVASGAMLGAQVGALTGVLSQRVLGQYDVALLEPEVRPRLLLLAPNLAAAAQSLAVDRDELVLWVTIHEITHAVQFAGAPWLRGYVGGLLRELIDGLQVSMLGGGSRRKLPDQAELRDLINRARTGQLLRLTLGEDRWRLVERMQATMSLIEGHAEHTMDAVGAQVLPSLPKLRAAMTRRRTQKGLPWRVLERLLGLELKMRQYELGRSFCDVVVRESGAAGLAHAWSGPEALPTMSEIEQPQLWLSRTSGLAA
ncbi:MAG TPA: zinc-dependent metalloprotease [Solirubrobacteraceae bacterium]|jgi:coenzyme F420 biosynthesis associated uncharacterized protein